ncbi:hypothetical protein TCAL_03685 [Tigriopus californicus]|uniref:Uncharacterized protein n=1 Tax=Tigriopus californicus TaxID=6832 RepID=A0A553N9U6_TIGCA|nr:hypothetical protein TCAL_03685 [Tigriopus californicus]
MIPHSSGFSRANNVRRCRMTSRGSALMCRRKVLHFSYLEVNEMPCPGTFCHLPHQNYHPIKSSCFFGA